MYRLPKDDSFPCYEGVGRASRGVAPELDEFGQRRVMLIETLRDRAKWPKGFSWDFGSSCGGGCAIGLTAQMVGRSLWDTHSEWMAEYLGISKRQAKDLFISGLKTYGTMDATPEMVASALDKVHRSILHPTRRSGFPMILFLLGIGVVKPDLRSGDRRGL